MNCCVLVAIGSLFFLPGLAGAAPLDYDEAILGDLSNLGSAPTLLAFGVGDNRVKGTMGRESISSVDPDIFTFTVPFGHQLTSIFLHFRDPAENSFYAIAAGSTIVMDSGATHLSNLLTRQNGELIEELAAFKEYGGVTMMTSPLGAGTYTAWYQELSTRVNYDFTYAIVPVPEPAWAGGLIAGFAVAVAWMTRRRAV